MALIQFSFLPTSSGKPTYQELLLASKFQDWFLQQFWLYDSTFFNKVLCNLHPHRNVHVFLHKNFVHRRCIRNWCSMEHFKKGHTIIWKIHGTVETILPWLQVRVLNEQCSFCVRLWTSKYPSLMLHTFRKKTWWPLSGFTELCI